MNSVCTPARASPRPTASPLPASGSLGTAAQHVSGAPQGAPGAALFRLPITLHNSVFGLLRPASAEPDPGGVTSSGRAPPEAYPGRKPPEVLRAPRSLADGHGQDIQCLMARLAPTAARLNVGRPAAAGKVSCSSFEEAHTERVCRGAFRCASPLNLLTYASEVGQADQRDAGFAKGSAKRNSRSGHCHP